MAQYCPRSGRYVPEEAVQLQPHQKTQTAATATLDYEKTKRAKYQSRHQLKHNQINHQRHSEALHPVPLQIGIRDMAERN